MSYLAFDTETTGLSADCNVLTSFFIILDSGLNQVATLDLQIKHDFYTVYTKALEINKIDLLEHDKNAIPKSEAIMKLENFLEKYKTNEKYIILGHNILFDLKMLRHNNILSKEIKEKYISNIYYDTLTLSRKLKSEKKIPYNQSLSLNKICYYYDISLNNECKFHNAEYDIKMTVELYKKLIEI